MTQSITTLDMVRHGEVHTPGLLCAPSNEPLSEHGWTQLAELRSGGEWEQIISSPSRRCREFSEQLAAERNIPLEIDSAWREINLGDWTGRTTESIWESDKSALLQLWENPMDFIAPGGEKMTDFVSRIQRASQRLFKKYGGKHLLLLTHAGVIRIVLAQCLEIDAKSVQKFNITHGKINRLCAYPGEQYSLLNWACSAADLNK